ncbi:hypothetical protein SCG7086_AA_00790, partial [Chlamydiales bacterium SCGC AG-110-P3]
MKVQYLAKHILLATVVLSAIAWLAVFRKGEGIDLVRQRTLLLTARPDAVLLGNSVLKAGINEDKLSTLTGSRMLKVTSNGSASAWWYLYVRNVLFASDYKPKRVMIFFRDSYLTDPTFRTSGKYRTPLRRISAGDETLVWQKAYGGNPDGVQLIISDDHPGLGNALRAVFPAIPW